MDAAWTQLQQQQEMDTGERKQQDKEEKEQQEAGLTATSDTSVLAQLFSRGQDEQHSGLTPGFLDGARHQRLVRGRAPRHRGLCLGRIAAVTRRGIVLRGLLHPLKRGDGLVVDQGDPEQQEQGGSVWDLAEPAAPAAGGERAGERGGRGGRGRHGSRSGSGGRRGAAFAGDDTSAAQNQQQSVRGEVPAGSDVEVIFGPGQVIAFRPPPPTKPRPCLSCLLHC